MAKAKRLPSGSWRCQVFSHYEKQVDKSGKPVIDVKTGKQKLKRCYESFTSDLPGNRGKRDAEAQAATFKNEKDRKKRPENLTVKEAFERYVKLKENVLSETTLRGYETIIRNHITDIEDKPLRTLALEDVQRWVNVLSLRLAPKTVGNAHGLFVSVANVFLPGRVFKTTLPQPKEPEQYTPSDDDVVKLLKYIEGTELEKAVLLAAFGSLRRAEVCGLKKEHIVGNSIVIKETKVRGRKGMLIKSPKTPDSCRTIVYPESVIRKFDEVEGPLVKMHPEDISKKFGKILDRAGIPRFRFHDLRHYTASIMHAIGIPDQYILKRGGWKSDRILKKIYRNTIDDMDKKFTGQINTHFDEMQHDMQHENSEPQ